MIKQIHNAYFQILLFEQRINGLASLRYELGQRRNGDPIQVAERLVAVSYNTHIFHIINYKNKSSSLIQSIGRASLARENEAGGSWGQKVHISHVNVWPGPWPWDFVLAAMASPASTCEVVFGDFD